MRKHQFDGGFDEAGGGASAFVIWVSFEEDFEGSPFWEVEEIWAEKVASNNVVHLELRAAEEAAKAVQRIVEERVASDLETGAKRVRTAA